MSSLSKALSAKKEEKEEKEEVKISSVIVKTYVSVGNSKRGYQVGSRIIRPNALGIYDVNPAEEAYFDSLVVAGFVALKTK